MLKEQGGLKVLKEPKELKVMWGLKELKGPKELKVLRGLKELKVLMLTYQVYKGLKVRLGL